MKSFFGALIICSSLVFAVASCSKSSKEETLGDNQIINIMMTVDKGEIAASEAALKKDPAPLVQAYAKYLIQMHQTSLDELTQLAKKLNLQPQASAISAALTKDGEESIKKLNDLQGKALDKAFIEAMIKDHQGGLNLIDTKLLPEAKSPELKVALEQFRKMVADHLEKGLQAQKAL